jgi:sulfate/thiosulfate transport system permease protein
MIPGRGLALGTTLTAVSLIVLIPLAAIVITAAGDTPAHIFAAAFSPRALAAYRVSGVSALIASAIDVVAGGFIAVVLVRYPSAGMKALDALVDVPFAIPTAVTGITLATLYGPHGWVGSLLAAHGIAIAYTPAGIVLALAFVGLPFVVRTVQPIVATLPLSFNEAAASLGATPFTIARRITLPLLTPGLLTGFALALARTLGEYGSVIFIAGNMPLHTEIAPLVIVTRLEEYDYSGAAAVAVVCLLASFVMLLAINALQRRLSALRSAA